MTKVTNIKQVRKSKDQKDSESTSNNAGVELLDYLHFYYQFIHDENKVVYALDKSSSQVFKVEGQDFKDVLHAQYYRNFNKVLRQQSLNEAISTLVGLGRYHGAFNKVHKRVALKDNSYFLDLCQEGNTKAVKISAEGWEIIDRPPVLFLRSTGMLPLPCPLKGGSIEDIWDICNIPENGRLLVLAWLCDCLRPDTPYPILELIGEQGSAKSTTHKALRMLIDPHTCNLRAEPRNRDDLFVSAGVNFLVSYENVSRLCPKIQDGLCVISTGAGTGKRKNYTDADEHIIHAKNPIILNGIVACITNQDAVDRTITIEQQKIKSKSVINDIYDNYLEKRPFILGALLDAFSEALSILQSISLSDKMKPRLIEYCYLGIALAKVLGFDDKMFIRQFFNNRSESITRAIEASPVGSAVIEWFEQKNETTHELPTKVLYEQVEAARYTNAGAWPQSPKGFSDALKRVAPALRQLGISCENLGKRGSYVYWRISKCEAVEDLI